MADLALWCRTVVAYLDSLAGPDPGWIGLKNAALEHCEQGHRRVLKGLQSELRQIAKEILPPAMIDELDRQLIEKTGEGISSQSLERRLSKILQKGRIGSEREYEIVRDHLHELEAQDQMDTERFATISGMLDSYKAKS